MSFLGNLADMPPAGRVFRQALLLAALPVGLVAFAGTGRADVIADVNAQLLNIIQNTSPSLIDGPPNVAREIAMVNGAMYDAVNAASGGTGSSRSLYYQGGPVANASAQAAALSAAYTVMNSLYGAGSLYATYAGVTGATYFGAGSPYANTIVGPTNSQYAAVLQDVQNVRNQLAGLAASTQVTNGTTLGAAAGQAMIDGRATDKGAQAMTSTLNYVAPTGPQAPGVYIPPINRPALEPTNAPGTGAAAVAPFVSGSATIAALEAAKAPGPAALNSAAYAKQLLETECQGGSVALSATIGAACTAAGFKPQTTAQATAALYWNDPGGTYQPPGHFLQIADAVAANGPGGATLSLLQHAQVDALVGAALSDAGAAAWDVKYRDNRWRPITAIQDCNADWAALNPSFTTCDTTWNSLIATPPHPDYIAGHPAFSGAAATVLDNFFQTDNVPFTVSSQAYCNGGSTTRAANGDTIACRVGATTFSISNSGDCNNAATQPVLVVNAITGAFDANPFYNGSPLICAISETFAGFQAASSGDLGSTYSRIAGGIHTPQAVNDALALGNAIGQLVSNDGNIPEPGTLAVLTVALAGIAMTRRRGVLGLVR